MHIQIFDHNTDRQQAIQQTVSKAARHITTNITVEVISDNKAIAQAGIFSYPTICIDGKVFASGYIPSETEVSKWFTRLGIVVTTPHAYACICGQCMPRFLP